MQSNLQQQQLRVINLLSVGSAQQVMLEVKIAEVSKTLIDKLGAGVQGSVPPDVVVVVVVVSPSSSDAATAAPPMMVPIMMPATGPDSIIDTGCSCASRADITPPLERMMLSLPGKAPSRTPRFIAVRTPEAKARLRPIAWNQPAITEAAASAAVDAIAKATHAAAVARALARAAKNLA